MSARALVFGVLVCFGCSSSPARSTTTPKTSIATPKAAATPCAFPSTIDRIDPSAARILLADDPLVEANGWRRAKKGKGLASSSGRRFELHTAPSSLSGLPDVDLVAIDGGTEVWRAKGFPSQVGSFAVMLSPLETVVARSYSLGLTELYDAATGAPITTTGNEVVVSPDDDYLVDPPWRTVAKLRPPLRILRLSDGKASSGAPLDAVAEETFEVGICSRGSTFAIARGSDELFIFDWPRLRRIRAHEQPGPGKLRFSRSGRVLATVDEKTGEPLRIFVLH
jgi:hypothetical protein